MQPHPSWMHELSRLTLTEWVLFFVMHKATNVTQGPRNALTMIS